MVRTKVRTMLKVGVGMCLMVAATLLLITNGVLSAPATTTEDATELPTDEDTTKFLDKFKSVTTNIKRYFGVFMNKMDSDLWMSVGIVFASVFILCCVIYLVVSSVNCIYKCLSC
ncbi:hypothetical protein HNY73_020160 [Argiope bruennichi]|uniref:Uncharacterized protein n=1 Tax=Argiope bruennichi TaxID=94029 RepID=A0A8T0E5Q2_ARGBR|nr:hypothetical protein HNY73_020160 [Argiope bruennichi]